jgi:hypothetical protein
MFLSRYLEHLSEYLASFLDRTQPLVNRQQLEDECREELNRIWANVTGDSLTQETELYCAPCNSF